MPSAAPLSLRHARVRRLTRNFRSAPELLPAFRDAIPEAARTVGSPPPMLT